MEKEFESEFCKVIGEKGEDQWSVRKQRKNRCLDLETEKLKVKFENEEKVTREKSVLGGEIKS